MVIITSGGQTGVDRAALDSAINSQLDYKGWCPKGRIDELGIIPEKYSELKEVAGDFKTEKENYDCRTKFNIRDSDATLIIIPRLPLSPEIKDGTLLTIQEVQKQKKPYLMIDLSNPINFNSELIVDWIQKHNLTTLNVAGPRESTCPGIYQLSITLLDLSLSNLKRNYSPRPKL